MVGDGGAACGNALAVGGRKADRDLLQYRQECRTIRVIQRDDPEALIGTADRIHPAGQRDDIAHRIGFTAYQQRVGGGHRRNIEGIAAIILALEGGLAQALDNARHLVG